MKKIEDSIRILKLLMQIDEGTPISEEDKKKLFEAYAKSKRSLEEVIDFMKGKADL